MERLARKEFVVMTAGAIAAAGLTGEAKAEESDIALTTPTGKIFGTLTLPSRARTSPQIPVVLIIAGSGPTDRDGNSPGLPGKMNVYLLLAQALASAGIASVRYDKRGVGASAAALTSESNIRFDDYIHDAEAWVSLLRSDRRFSRVVVAGHSEGSLVGMVAARVASADSYVSLEGAGRPIQVVLGYQLRNLPAPLKAESEAIITSLEGGHTVLTVSPELLALFRPSVQPYLISWFKYDPAVEIAKLKIPVTIVQGTADVQVIMADEAALASAAPTAHVVIVDGMNHVLKHAPDTSSQSAILAGYTDPALPLMPQAIAAVVSASSASH